MLGLDYSIIPFSWTLRIEFLFYVIAFAAYTAGARWHTGVLKMFVAFFYIVLFIFLLRGGHDPNQIALIPYFLFGIAVYRLFRQKRRLEYFAVSLASVSVLLAFPFWNQSHNPVVYYQLPLLAILLASFAYLAMKPRVSSAFKSIDIRLGELSYPLYLNQYIVLLFLSNITHRYGIFLYLTGILLSVVLAQLMHFLVEIPLKPLRDRVRGTALESRSVS
jgi:peptidoglycan/LPS O-acetylase OafA/YrhL